jgi:uncharacterized C2H2 Zn-finger protein
VKSSENVLKSSESGMINSDNKKTYNCRRCNKIFNNVKTRWSHEKKCTVNNDNEIDNLKKEIDKLKNKLVSITNNTTNNNSNNNNNNNITNNIINNKYVMFPNFEYKEVLTKEEIIDILNKNEEAIEESVMKIHFNDKFPEFQNIYISNLRDSKVHIFDGKQFIVTNKNQTIT